MACGAGVGVAAGSEAADASNRHGLMLFEVEEVGEVGLAAGGEAVEGAAVLMPGGAFYVVALGEPVQAGGDGAGVVAQLAGDVVFVVQPGGYGKEHGVLHEGGGVVQAGAHQAHGKVYGFH